MKHSYFVQKFEETTTLKERKKIFETSKILFLQVVSNISKISKFSEIKRNFLHHW